MSIDIDWERATSGPDGELLAERIRSFIHDKFQQIVLPRFIRSVQVTSFNFGTIPPELEIRDLCDPFPDFYEEDDNENFSESSEEQSPTREPVDRYGSKVESWQANSPGSLEDHMQGRMGFNGPLRMPPGEENTGISPLRSPMNFGDINPYLFPRSRTPGIPGGTSNLGYYMPLSGLSGSQTPLGTVARGSPFSGGWPDVHGARPSRRRSEVEPDSAQSRPSTANTGNTLLSRGSMSSGDPRHSHHSQGVPGSDHGQVLEPNMPPTSSDPPLDDLPPRRMREQKAEDFQVFCRTKYAGNISLSLTAEILLDYPMPSFVGLPLKLNITGLTFDAVAVIAYIRRRIHFCFLSPEDADALIGPEIGSGGGEDTLEPNSPRRKPLSLLREIRVESEIGRKENGKQALKNVGKVEKFVLEQVRRIFEEEFVYPSFWTFLV
ncbi:mitochondrial distribution and morphology protein 12 [Blastomyces dermatitidis ER-3]|uniref:Mitochondrial distribution and morphology protein 12 n=2 Tax=Ajellomyces dermatitidis TaxID=5039 RepID=MDM12_AJEDR|nr:mitochondrial distribution and morphology protein 12 [Blastomyces dermatitidis ER-3]C5GK63.1 RecName: Full=Mitochondrial distribution and morphology protein 12; AltName: Full=Mitochondrial inheritance component MDM12 [Blastomyces dermatitidis ER-3]EEQ89834.1 mitochondrial distribution and morphology protein 12 [Blastomyces dermatitidis ER-3]EGE86847.1 mitochondrial distribution and morphology protein 12 [Blastomyces dermatitidis ATCC 18188]